jgi:type VI secretion system protein ImpK
MNSDEPNPGSSGYQIGRRLPTPGVRRGGDNQAGVTGRGTFRSANEPDSNLFQTQPEIYTQQETRFTTANPLVSAASDLLSLSGNLRGTIAQPQIDKIRQYVELRIRTYKSTAVAQGANTAVINQARFALCVLLDETVLNTPWGIESTWRETPLLSRFYNETSGKKKFISLFKRVSRECQQTPEAVNLLELLVLCRLLGLESAYRSQASGCSSSGFSLTDAIATIESRRGKPEETLSPHWQGVQRRRNPLVSYVPVWVVCAVAVAIMLTSFATFSYLLNKAAAPVFESLSHIGRPPQPATRQLDSHVDLHSEVPQLHNELGTPINKHWEVQTFPVAERVAINTVSRVKHPHKAISLLSIRDPL